MVSSTTDRLFLPKTHGVGMVRKEIQAERERLLAMFREASKGTRDLQKRCPHPRAAHRITRNRRDVICTDCGGRIPSAMFDNHYTRSVPFP